MSAELRPELTEPREDAPWLLGQLRLWRTAAIVFLAAACGPPAPAVKQAPPSAIVASAVAPAPAERPTSAPHAARAFGKSVGFRSRDNLSEHFSKHGREFGRVTMNMYLEQAQSLRDAPLSDRVLELIRDDDVVSRFDRDSGSFLAFNADGTIRTFFRPNDGERYFRRQAKRRPTP